MHSTLKPAYQYSLLSSQPPFPPLTRIKTAYPHYSPYILPLLEQYTLPSPQPIPLTFTAGATSHQHNSQYFPPSLQTMHLFPTSANNFYPHCHNILPSIHRTSPQPIHPTLDCHYLPLSLHHMQVTLDTSTHRTFTSAPIFTFITDMYILSLLHPTQLTFTTDNALLLSCIVSSRLPIASTLTAATTSYSQCPQ